MCKALPIKQYAMQGPIYRRMIDFTREHPYGIRCITTPTGSGKTYVAARLFAETFFASPDTRMVYVVPLKENRNSFAAECLTAAKAVGYADDDICRLSDSIFVAKSQMDCLVESYSNENGWQEIGTRISGMKKSALRPEFDRLDEAMHKYKNLKKTLELAKADSLTDELMRQCTYRVNSLKRACLGELRSEFREYRNSVSECNLSLYEYYQLHIEAWGWMESLWPAIQVPEKRIFILTPEKLLSPEDTVISGTFSWVNPDGALGNSPIAILDEGDSIKGNFLGTLASNAAKGEIDPFNFLSRLYVAAAGWLENPDVLKEGGVPSFNKTVDSNITDDSWNFGIDPQKILSAVVNLLRAAKNELYVDCSYKLEDSSSQSYSAFMFPGYSSTVGFDGAERYRVLPHSTDNKDTRGIKNHIVKGNISQKSESLQLLVTRAVRMDSVLFKYLFDFALLYQHNKNMQAYVNFDMPSKKYDRITIEQAVSSVVNELFYGLHSNGNGYVALSRAILNQTGGNFKRIVRIDEPGIGLNIWGRGDSILQLGNSPHNDTKSEVRMNSMSVTPELVLATIGKSYRAIMMSASLGIDSSNNFEFKHFLDHIADLDVVHDDEKQMMEIKNLQDSINEQTGKLVACEVHIVGIRQNHDGRPLCITPNSPEVGPIYRKGGQLRKTWDALCNEYCSGRKDTNDLYLASKLWSLAEVMYECIGRKSVHSVLCIVERSLDSHGIFTISNAERLMKAAGYDKGLSDYELKRYHVYYLSANNWHEMMDESRDSKGAVPQALDKGDTVFLVTTGKNAEAGKNIQRFLVPSQEDDYVCIYPGDAHTMEAPIRCDWDAIYREKPTHDFVTDIKADDISDGAERISILHEGIYQWTAQYDRDEIDRGTLRDSLNCLLSKAFSPNSQVIAKRRIGLQGNTSLGNIYAMHLVQSLGRLERTYMRPKTCLVFIDSDLADAINTDAAKNLPVGYLYSRTIQSIRAYQEKRLDVLGPRENNERRLKRAFLRTTNYCSDWIKHKLNSAQRRGYWTPGDADEWARCRDMLLTCPSSREPPAGIDFYWHTEGETFSEYFTRMKASDSKKRGVDACIVTDAEAWTSKGDSLSAAGQSIFHPDSNPDGWPYYAVTEDTCRLSLVRNVPLLREWWTSKHYALHFTEGEYHMLPVMAKNIYKGAIGEECLAAAASHIISERNMKLRLGPMPTELTEKFDFALYKNGPDGSNQDSPTGIYFDAKNWDDSFDLHDEDAQKAIAHAEDKLSECNGTWAVIVNIFGNLDEEYADIGPLIRGRVITIPMLWGYHGPDNDYALIEEYARGWLELIDILEQGEKC